MAEVCGLDGYPAGEAVPEVVEFLEGQLRAAKAGQLRGVAFAAIVEGGYCRWAYEPGEEQVTRLIGAVEAVKAVMVGDLLSNED